MCARGFLDASNDRKDSGDQLGNELLKSKFFVFFLNIDRFCEDLMSRGNLFNLMAAAY